MRRSVLQKFRWERTQRVQSERHASNGERVFAVHQKCADVGRAEIPSARGLPLVGTLLEFLRFGSIGKVHEYCDARHKRLGPIFRERVGHVDAVFVADGRLVQTVIRQEGKFPVHMVPENWTIYNENSGCKRGLFFMNGEEWADTRKALNKFFLDSTYVQNFSSAVDAVVDRTMCRWDSMERDNVVPNLEKEFYHWSIENVSMLDEFVQHIRQIFVESATMSVVPPSLAFALRLPTWRRFERAVTQAIRLANGYFDQMVSKLSRDCRGGPEFGVLGSLLYEEKLGEELVRRIVIDLLLAAADTTSHAMQWCLYLIAKHPKFQETIDSVSTQCPTTSATLVKAAIKETLRLYPVAPFLTRIMDKDITLDGYEIPKGTLLLISLYTMGRDGKNFDRPLEFLPERWIRKESSQTVVNTHACLPFGLGARSCVGRKISEMAMQHFICRVNSLARDSFNVCSSYSS